MMRVVRGGSWVVLAGLAMVASPASAGKFPRPGMEIPKDLPDAVEVQPAQPGPPPPEPKGWPNKILTASEGNCAREPGPLEVIVYRDANFTGRCVVLPGVGSYPNADNMGIRNDGISSMHNNSGLRLQGFWHPDLSLMGADVPPHRKVDTLSSGGWFTKGINDNISSVRMAQ